MLNAASELEAEVSCEFRACILQLLFVFNGMSSLKIFLNASYMLNAAFELKFPVDFGPVSYSC